MATLEFMAGLDFGTTYPEVLEGAGAFANNTSGVTILPTGGPYGTQAVFLGANDRGLIAAVTPNTWYHLGVAFKATEDVVTNWFISQGDTTSTSISLINMGLVRNVDGSIVLYGDGGIRGTSAPGLVQKDTWVFVEVIFQASSSGTGLVYVNGTEVINTTGDFFDGNSVAAYAMFGHQNGGSDFQLDDPFCFTSATNDFTVLGEWRIETLVPDGDTAQADFTGSYTDIDDPVPGYHDGDTTFISSATLNHESEFSMANLTATGIQSIQGVRTVIAARKEDTGVAEYTPYIVSGASSTDGDVPVLTTDYAYGHSIFETDPNGGGSWTESAVNASLLGVRITDV